MKPTIVLYKNLDEYQDIQENVEIKKMIKEREKTDNGKRFSLEELEAKVKLQDFLGE